MPTVIDGSTGVDKAQPGAQVLNSGTVVATTSGTSIDFTGIPSWAKRVSVLLSGVSVSGTASLQLQLGTSGGVANSGYTSVGTVVAASTSATANTTGFLLPTGNASYGMSGIVTFDLISGTTWVGFGGAGNTTTTNFMSSTAGFVTLSASLDRVRLTTTNGTDTFDAGSANVFWE